MTMASIKIRVAGVGTSGVYRNGAAVASSLTRAQAERCATVLGWIALGRQAKHVDAGPPQPSEDRLGGGAVIARLLTSSSGRNVARTFATSGGSGILSRVAMASCIISQRRATITRSGPATSRP